MCAGEVLCYVCTLGIEREREREREREACSKKGNRKRVCAPWYTQSVSWERTEMRADRQADYLLTHREQVPGIGKRALSLMGNWESCAGTGQAEKGRSPAHRRGMHACAVQSASPPPPQI